ncbi:MAG: hypothetical protein AAGJ81_08340 [Verrucomicrobiota bacterium]
MPEESDRAAQLKILRLLRWLSVVVAVVLFVSASRTFIEPPWEPAWFFVSRAVFEILLGILLLLPFGRWGETDPGLWRRMFFVLIFFSVIFVFARIIGVLFSARVIEAGGGELGLPAWDGTLIFLVLAQLPILLFLRFPDQLD